jgi:hypothetical protein
MPSAGNVIKLLFLIEPILAWLRFFDDVPTQSDNRTCTQNQSTSNESDGIVHLPFQEYRTDKIDEQPARQEWTQDCQGTNNHDWESNQFS